MARLGHARRSTFFSIGAMKIVLGCWAMLGAARAEAGPQLTPVQQLGQALFFDTTLSNPHGLSCSTCHSPQAGWTNSNPAINLIFGTVPGAVPGRFGNRRPPTISYASFLTQGPPTLNPEFGLYVGGVFYDGRAKNF